MKIIPILLVLVLILTGCATAYDAEKRQLTEDYQSGKIDADTYYANMGKVLDGQIAHNEAVRAAIQQSQTSQQKTQSVSTYSRPKQYNVYSTNGKLVGTAQERQSFPDPEAMAAVGLRASD